MLPTLRKQRLVEPPGLLLQQAQRRLQQELVFVGTARRRAVAQTGGELVERRKGTPPLAHRVELGAQLQLFAQALPGLPAQRQKMRPYRIVEQECIAALLHGCEAMPARRGNPPAQPGQSTAVAEPYKRRGNAAGETP